LLFDLARRYQVDLTKAALVGDALSDIEAGQAAGCRTVLVLTGRGRDELDRAAAAGMGGFLVASDLGAATELLLCDPSFVA
jgi:D-glycero-D-manno-heptose 1,7-bisphosphate phosphatase